MLSFWDSIQYHLWFSWKQQALTIINWWSFGLLNPKNTWDYLHNSQVEAAEPVKTCKGKGSKMTTSGHKAFRHFHLVGGWPTPPKNMKVNWDDELPNIWENKKCSKSPTSHGWTMLNVFEKKEKCPESLRWTSLSESILHDLLQRSTPSCLQRRDAHPKSQRCLEAGPES